MTRKSRSSRSARIALGETGFERAAVWSAVGFALSYVAFEAVALAVSQVDSPTVTATVISVITMLTAIGVITFVAVGGGVMPAVLLAYGPFAAILLRTTGPEPYTIPFDAPVSFLFTVAEPLGLALAGAVAVGLAGYVVGRILLGFMTDDDAVEGTEDGSKSEDSSESEDGSESEAKRKSNSASTSDTPADDD